MEERQPMGDVPAGAVRGPVRCMTASLALLLLLSNLACGGSEGSALVTSSDPRLENIEFYKGKLQIHTNGLRVEEVPCTISATCAQQ